MGELIDDVEHSIFPANVVAVLDKVVGPDVIAVRSGRSRMHDPSESQSRPRLGCLWGTFSPSRRQIRSTRLSLTSQPACSSNPAILR